MSSPRTLFVLALALGELLRAGDVHADAASAEALFNHGRRLLMEGKLDEACEKLSASERLDPSSGTLLNLALCHEKQGKLATAWAEYKSAARLARAQSRPQRALTADARAAELEPRLPRITIVVRRAVPGFELVRDGERLGPGATGTAMPIDPGSHRITASAEGYRTWTESLEVIEGSDATVEVPDLEPVPPAPPAEATKPPSQEMVPARRPLRPSVAPATAPGSERGAGDRGSTVTGWAVAGGGVLALGVGTWFGVQSLRAYDRADSACPTHASCPASAVDARKTAERDAWIANVAIPMGVVGSVLGAYLLSQSWSARATSGSTPSVAFAPHGGVVAWTQAF